jgi:hypothetical protein
LLPTCALLLHSLNQGGSLIDNILCRLQIYVALSQSLPKLNVLKHEALKSSLQRGPSFQQILGHWLQLLQTAAIINGTSIDSKGKFALG